MSDNVLQTLQRLVQDVIAPDVRELKVRLESLAKETETRFAAMDRRMESIKKIILSAIAERARNPSLPA